jgi:hypothetical protein
MTLLKTYQATFETDYGLDFAKIEAKNIREATKILKKEFPNEIGADGFWSTEDGDERFIDW